MRHGWHAAAVLAGLLPLVAMTLIPITAAGGPSDLPVIIIPIQPPIDEDTDDANFSIVIRLVEPSTPWIRPGQVLRWTVEGGNITNVTVGIDDYDGRPFPQPYTVNTSAWEDGQHVVWIAAFDDLNHSELKFYNFVVDTTPPSLDFSVPYDGDPLAEPSDIVTLLFSEKLDNRSVAGNVTLLLGPGAEGSGIEIDGFSWLKGGLQMDIRLTAPPDPESYLMVSVSPGIRDLAGNEMGVWSNVTWRTWNDADLDGIPDSLDEDDDADGTPDIDDYRPFDPEIDSWIDVYWWVPTLLCIAAVAVIGAAGLLLYRE